MGQPFLEIRDLVHRYDSRTVLSIDRLAVESGEVLVVLGPNGSGKSTLLRMIGLLEHPTSGQVLITGQDGWATGDLNWRRKMASVFQEPLLFSGTVFDNVAYGLRLRRGPRAEIRMQVDQALEKLRISHLARRPSNKLSGGEAQRVALARALVIEPELLLLDEPLASLDPPTREGLLEDLQHLLAETDVTAVYVTHNRQEAMILGDRTAIMMDGQIVQLGSAQAVFASPVNEEVADLVGVETIIRGQVVSVADGLARIKVDGEEIEAVGEAEPGEEVLIFLRPENLMILEPKSVTKTSARNYFEGKITKMTNLGALFRLTIDSCFPLVSFVTKKSVEEMDLSVGRTVGVAFKATGVHVVRCGVRCDSRESIAKAVDKDGK